MSRYKYQTLHPDMREPLCLFAEAFANMPQIETMNAPAEMLREYVTDLALVDSFDDNAQRFGAHVNEFHLHAIRNDQALLRDFLDDLSDGKPRRAELGAHLRTLIFAAALEFDSTGRSLRVFPRRFGVKAAAFLALAAAMEHDTSVKVSKCADCKKKLGRVGYAIDPGTGGPPRAKCVPHSEKGRKSVKRLKRRLK